MLTERHGHRTERRKLAGRTPWKVGRVRPKALYTELYGQLFGWRGHGFGYGPIALWTCNRRAERAAESDRDSIIISADRHVEMASPISYYITALAWRRRALLRSRQSATRINRL